MKKSVLIECLSKIAWAYLFIYLNFNFNFSSVRINLIPTWVGYRMLYETIPVLKNKQKTLALLEPLCYGLMICYGIEWGLNILGISINITVVNLLLNIADLYFHFQFLTDLAELLACYQLPSTGKLYQLRTVRTILLTIQALPLSWTQIKWVVIVLAVLYLTVIVMTCTTLFTLKDELSEKDDCFEMSE